MNEVVTLRQIAERMGTPPEVVLGWHYFTDELPSPDAVVDTEPVWTWATVESWATSTGRSVRHPYRRKESAR